MKQIILLISILAMVFLVGCTNAYGTQTSYPTNPNPQYTNYVGAGCSVVGIYDVNVDNTVKTNNF